MRVLDVLPAKRALVHAAAVRRREFAAMLTSPDDRSAISAATTEVSILGLGLGTVAAAEPIWVADKVMPELQSRVSSAEPFRIGSVTPYASHGIVFFERSVTFDSTPQSPDDPQVQLPIDAVSWARGAVPYNDGGHIRRAPGVVVMMWVRWATIQPHLKPDVAASIEQTTPASYFPMTYVSARYGGWFKREISAADDAGRAVPFDGDVPEAAAESTAAVFVHTLWQMLTEDITITSREEVPRKQQKMMRRANLRDTLVTAVHLRHRHYDRPAIDGEPTRVDWSHRWYVRGHERRIIDRTTGEARTVWVRPYVKGPDGKPLRVREHVYALDR